MEPIHLCMETRIPDSDGFYPLRRAQLAHSVWRYTFRVGAPLYADGMP